MKIIREPLFHFAAIGLVLFGVYAWASARLTVEENLTIRIGASEIELLTATFARQWQRPPTPTELENLIEARVREEVLYREALAVGLDQNDMVVRRRMVQKMEMLSQDLALLADPTDAELQAFFDDNREDYRVPPQLTFSHIYFNVDQRGADAENDANRVLADVGRRNPSPNRAPELGDRFMLGYDFRGAPPSQIARSFGQRFADSLVELDIGWHGPVLSGYGLHLVHIEERVEGRLPDLAEVRDRVVMDFNRDRTERSKSALYEGLREKYNIEIDPEALGGAEVSAPRKYS